MVFETHPLNDFLKAHIESIFHYKGFQPDHSIERVVPTGHVFIIFELDGMLRNTFDNETLVPNGSYAEVWVSGMHKNYLSISAHQDSEMLVIQFKTNGSYPFFHSPMHELNDRVVAASEIFGKEIRSLRTQLLEAQDSAKKFTLVENWLDSRFVENKVAPPKLLELLIRLQTEPLTESSKLISSFPNTQKHLINQFKTYFGLTPKVLHRIFRFNELLKQIQNKNQLKWSQIAYEFGYSDQSHFIKEFKAFSGFNPQEFLNLDYHKGETNFFPLDNGG